MGDGHEPKDEQIAAEYEAPALIELGSFTELTQGGGVSFADGGGEFSS